MKNAFANFNQNQLVKIVDRDQFDIIYPLLRSAQKGIDLITWVHNINYGYPDFPIYLEHAKSNFVTSIGFRKDTTPSWGCREYEILSFEEGISYI